MDTTVSINNHKEGGRVQRLLLGCIVSLAVLYTGLELTVVPDDPLDNDNLIDRLESVMELPAVLQENNTAVLAPKAEPKPETRLVVVEEASEEVMLDDYELLETDFDPDLDFADDEVTTPEDDPADAAEPLRVVEDMPQFPGGPAEFMKWLNRNIHYPEELQARKLKGKVVAQFVVGTDGSVTDVLLTKKLHPLCDQEVMRVMQMMPRWTPGIDKGKPCRTLVCVPVQFEY